eukprot:151325-Chlamydomonas_euryale.AAC.11
MGAWHQARTPRAVCNHAGTHCAMPCTSARPVRTGAEAAEILGRLGHYVSKQLLMTGDVASSPVSRRDAQLRSCVGNIQVAVHAFNCVVHA